MADEWKHCVDWLIKCGILPQNHKAKQFNAEIFDLAQTLRDGVLLCHLLNMLKPYSVDSKDFSPRPQLSQVILMPSLLRITCDIYNDSASCHTYITELISSTHILACNVNGTFC